ncbi:MAG: class I adenylate-forming enzyme family protein [Verrucomicrobiota bacterium]
MINEHSHWTLADILDRGSDRWSSRVAVADAAGSSTYNELADRSRRLANWLTTQGVEAGDRVLLSLPNSVRFVEALFAVQFAGAVSVPLDPTLALPQRQAIEQSATPKFALDDNTPWEEAFNPSPIPSIVRRGPSDLAALMYTTGTTGEPKGVMLTHRNIFAALRNIIEFVGYTERDREVVTLPLSHNFGLGHVYCNLFVGGAVFLEPGLSRVGRVLKAIESFGATGFPTTPLGVGLLLDRYGEVFAERAKGLRFMVVNSAPLPPERTAQLQKCMPKLDIMVYYGLTEASRSTFISLSQEGPDRYASVGPAMNGVKVKLDEQGQVVIGGPTVTQGYWDSPEQTNQAIKSGELHTGDLGRFDDDGYLYIVGRQNDLINLGGYKINPMTVERVVEGFVGVQECGVAGVDAIKAFVVAETEFDEDALTRHCREYLQNHEVPSAFVCVDKLPRTDSGKLKRQDLLKLDCPIG